MELELRQLTAGYGGRPILEDLSLRMEKGRITAIIGANGSGKSTMLKAMSRILKPTNGTVCLDGRSLPSWKNADLARALAILPQAHAIPEDLTVRDLVSCGRFPHRRAKGNTPAKNAQAVGRALDLACASELADRLLPTLSGGERQRAWLAMTLAQEPKILLLDEPTTFLDIRFQFEVLDLISKLNRELGLTVVMVLHDLNHAARYAQRIVAVKDGRAAAQGTPEEVLVPETLKDVFGIQGIVTRECGYPHFIPTSCA